MINVRLMNAVALISVLLPLAAIAAPAVSTHLTNAEILADSETLPTSRALIAAMTLLGRPGRDETTLRSAAGLSARSTFPLAGAAVPLLQGSGDIARRAFGSFGVAYLIKLPATSAGLGSEDPAREANYALVTVSGSATQIWAFYTQIPSDAALGRRMIAALAKLERPFASFDPSKTTSTAGAAVAP